MKIANAISGTLGNTPLVRLNKLAAGLPATVAVKLEFKNPLGSVKDRIGVSMIDEAEKQGLIHRGRTTIIEPTSGNTGIALAFVSAERGYKCILVMPDTASMERRKLLAALGAKVVLTPGLEGMTVAMAKADELARQIPDSWVPGQFDNPANPKIHRETTGPEIWNDSEGKVDIFVSGVGTGGTLTGTGQFLKSKNPQIKVVAVEPTDSPVITQRLAGEELKPSPHKIQGIGAGFIPSILDLSIIDEVVQVTNEQAFDFARKISHEEGILSGISSGAALCAALKIAARPENKGKLIVTILPSSGERYLSTPLFAELELAAVTPVGASVGG
jgi:cysteine synthase